MNAPVPDPPPADDDDLFLHAADYAQRFGMAAYLDLRAREAAGLGVLTFDQKLKASLVVGAPEVPPYWALIAYEHADPRPWETWHRRERIYERMAPLLVKALPALRQWVGARFGEARLQAELERIHADFRKHWCPEADSEVEHEIAELEDLLHELPAGPIGERAAGETNWLLFRLQSKPGGKADKLPCADNGRGPISLHLAARWRYVDVWCEARNHGTPYGVGYLPRPGSALIGIDFDNALTSDGRIKPWAEQSMVGGQPVRARHPRRAGARPDHARGQPRTRRRRAVLERKEVVHRHLQFPAGPRSDLRG
jgi:hypothetical protein